MAIKVGSLVEYQGREYRTQRGTVGIVKDIDDNLGDDEGPCAIVDFFSLGVIPAKHRILFSLIKEIEVVDADTVSQ